MFIVLICSAGALPNCASCKPYLPMQHITDLLEPGAGKSLSVRVHPKQGPFVEGLSAQPVSSGESASQPRCHAVKDLWQHSTIDLL